MVRLVDFYSTALPPQGWTYRYTDANYLGGVTQFWKDDSTYLSVRFGCERSGVMARVDYQRVAADALEKLPEDLPIPDEAELTNASDTSWDLYIDQDYAAVNAFFTNASAGWARGSGFGAMEGEGDDGGPACPAGVDPMPAPTRDSRSVKSYSWILPDQNQVDIDITPHGSATLVHITLTGQTADVPVYPGATNQNAMPGMVTFQAGAGMETVKAYYEKELNAAGWTPEGQPMESTEMIMLSWKKGNQTIMITVAPAGVDDCFVTIISEGS
jgi:hypothetical protein